MNIAARVQHHPSRAALLDELLPRLAGLLPEVIIDPGGVRSSWRTHRLCLESVPDDATHLLVLQDDAWPCDDFPALCRAAIAERPDRIICLFVPGVGNLIRRIDVARKRGDRWFDFPQITFLPLVGIVYPAEVAREIPRFADKKRIPVGRADDAVIGQFARAHKQFAVATLPSLVEHRDEVASVMRMPSGAGRPHRLAAWFQDAPLATSDVLR